MVQEIGRRAIEDINWDGSKAGCRKIDNTPIRSIAYGACIGGRAKTRFGRFETRGTYHQVNWQHSRTTRQSRRSRVEKPVCSDRKESEITKATALIRLRPPYSLFPSGPHMALLAPICCYGGGEMNPDDPPRLTIDLPQS